MYLLTMTMISDLFFNNYNIRLWEYLNIGSDIMVNKYIPLLTMISDLELTRTRPEVTSASKLVLRRSRLCHRIMALDKSICLLLLLLECIAEWMNIWIDEYMNGWMYEFNTRFVFCAWNDFGATHTLKYVTRRF